jgi:predicted Zn-dependent protease with MMP-like domain
MTFSQFETRAHEIFEAIPEHFREGVDGLVVERHTQLHPELPGIYTLGECVTEQYPSEFGGAGEVRSLVVLYHGSFRRVAEQDEEWDWEEELFETITHEVRHHLESLASEDALEVEDYVVDQNFARREGEPFEPLFYRDGTAAGEGAYLVDGDLFLEHEVDGAEAGVGGVEVEWEGIRFRVQVPDPLGDLHFVTVAFSDEAYEPAAGDTVLVLHRRRSAWESLRKALGGGTEVLHSTARGEVLG